MRTNDQVRKKMIEAAQGVDTQNLLNHIAWTDVVRPELLAERERFQQLLVSAILNGEPLTANGKISKEQLAGRIAGIDWVIEFLERKIIERGQKAEDALTEIGLRV